MTSSRATAARPLVALDAGTYDPDVLREYRGTHPWVVPWWDSFRGAAERAGFDFTMARDLPDVLDRPALLVAQGWSASIAALVRRRDVVPAILMSLESPMIAWDFYHDLPSLGALFRRVFVFPGAKRRVKPVERFRPLHAPQVPPGEDLLPPEAPWSDRRFLVSVNANKFVQRVSIPELVRAIVARLLSRRPQELGLSVRRQLTCLVDRELSRGYDERLSAILHFSGSDDFDLYGRGWRTPDHYSAPPDVLRRVLRRYVGEPIDFRAKLEVMSKYRFALVTENTSFPGYISEKIFDCLFAGAVPVYHGAPDIEQYVASDAFVDMRRFRGMDELERFLRDMDAHGWQRLREAGRRFLASPSFREFHHQTVATKLVHELEGLIDEGHAAMKAVDRTATRNV